MPYASTLNLVSLGPGGGVAAQHVQGRRGAELRVFRGAHPSRLRPHLGPLRHLLRQRRLFGE